MLNTLRVPLIWILFPETKGLRLEEVDRLFTAEYVRQLPEDEEPVLQQ